MKYLKLSMIVALFGLFSVAHANVAIGDAAPEFTLTDTHGETHSLSDFEGKIVVLEWFNHGCPFVVKHYSEGNMQSLQEKYTEEGVIWLSICSSNVGKQGYDSPEGHNSTAEELGKNPTAILLDVDGTVGRAFGARVTPHMYVIDAEGNLAYQGAIDDRRSTNPAHIPDSKNYVAAALDALLAGEEVEITTSQPYGCTVKY